MGSLGSASTLERLRSLGPANGTERAMRDEDERERKVMGLEFILGGLQDGLAVMPEGCDEARSFASLVPSVEERLRALGSSPESGRRVGRRSRRETR